MIISHEHKFIFLKTAKTAGTSIEIALSKFCGSDDVITKIARPDQRIRSEVGYPGPQNDDLPLRGYAAADLLWSLRHRRKSRYRNHFQSRQIKRCVGEDVWNRYYKFCFERNPWDRVISQFYWLSRGNPTSSISEFIDSDAPRLLKRKGIDVYTIDGQVVVDRVCRYEDVENELERVCSEQLGLPEKLVLPRAKGGYRGDRRPYREVLGDEDREKIARIFADEIELFGYEF